MQRELFPEINSIPESCFLDTIPFFRVFETEELYISIIQISDYRPMNLASISRTIQGRTTNVNFKFNATVFKRRQNYEY